MATSDLPNQRIQVTSDDQADRLGSIRRISQLWIRPLASLKLTVILFAMSVFIVLVGTLAQVEKGMWEVMEDYFTSWIALIEFQTFFPRSWFPKLQNIPGVFPFPGGASIGLAMVINLVAAHLVRFKIHTRGVRLGSGVALVLFGMFVTCLVIMSGHDQQGLQGKPPFSWETLWSIMLLGIAMGGVLAGGGAVATFSRVGWKAPSFILLTFSSITLLALACWLSISGRYLGDSGMRILWQLIQGGLAGLVLLAGCILVFKQRAGIVLIHGGVGLLMLGQYFVSQYDVEEQMRISEGETVNFGQDIRCVELAIVNLNDSQHPNEDRVVVVPLTRNGKRTTFLTDQQIRDDDLPFDVEIIRYFRNSHLRERRDDEKNLATRGVGVESVAEERRTASGAGGSEVDLASMYVKLTKKNNQQDLGTYLVTQWLMTPETVKLQDKEYQLSLRFERHYKPYSMHLIDVRKDDYLGTSVPRNYSSDVRLVDFDRNVERDVHIRMNDPLRYAGETFYQSGYQEFKERETTTLQVVKNSGWMTPYVACMLVATGMLAHFLNTLLRFLNRRKASFEERVYDMTDYVVLGVVLVVALVIVLFCAIPRPTDEQEMQIDKLGALPLVYEGRIQPYDTLARNSLRMISDRSTYRDVEKKKQPAVRWLLDVVTHSEAADRHRVFRIQNQELLGTLSLSRRKGYRYAFEEIKPQMEEFRKQVDLARSIEVENLSVYQKKVLELEKRMQVYFQLREAFRVPEATLQDRHQQGQLLLNLARVKQELSASPVPRAIPTDATEESWVPLSSAATMLWIQNIAESEDITDSVSLVKHWTDPFLSPENLDQLVSLRVLNLIVEHLRSENSQASDETIYAQAQEQFQQLPEHLRETVRESVKKEVQTSFEQSISNILDGRELTSPPNQVAKSTVELFAAYRENDRERFNEKLTAIQNEVNSSSVVDASATKTMFENFFNRSSLLLVAFIFYIVAFILGVLSWLIWHRTLRRASFGLIVFTFGIHTFVLIARIYISGRPPVTNLYSSAIFIGWGGVVLGLMLEFFSRMSIGNVASSVAGFATLVIAFFLSFDGDTFGVLQAVLDTQFWLATHVVCITFGYATTYMAGLLGIFYIVGGLLTPALSAGVRKELIRMIYGIVCFSIFFSFVGTVLGGLWADDSWGRFWGWDPKENGALIIVLWNALVLHARWGAMVRERGFALLATAGNVAVSWSWFGVNELGVGLHSYGFTEGVLLSLVWVVIAHLAIIAVGLIPTRHWWSYRSSL